MSFDLSSDPTQDLYAALEQVAWIVEAKAEGSSPGRVDRLRRTVFDLIDELHHVVMRPDDPINCRVVEFSKRFRDNGDTYTYAACRADDGYWYVTGSDKHYTWDALLDHIEQGDKNALRTLRYLEPIKVSNDTK